MTRLTFPAVKVVGFNSKPNLLFRHLLRVDRQPFSSRERRCGNILPIRLGSFIPFPSLSGVVNLHGRILDFRKSISRFRLLGADHPIRRFRDDLFNITSSFFFLSFLSSSTSSSFLRSTLLNVRHLFHPSNFV